MLVVLDGGAVLASVEADVELALWLEELQAAPIIATARTVAAMPIFALCRGLFGLGNGCSAT